MDSRQTAFAAANIAHAKKGQGTLILDVSHISIFCDYFVITGGDTTTQVRAIVEAIDEQLSKFGYTCKSIEGKKEARWVLMDYKNVVVQVLKEEERNYYKLEQCWNHALVVDRREWLKDFYINKLVKTNMLESF
jgi:ribosome-associated protein